MANNTTGGIILFILGAVIITMGVSEKGKRVFNILVGGGGSDSPDAPVTEPEKEPIFKETDPSKPKDYKDDPKPLPNGEKYGFVGEKGAGYVG